MTQSSTEMVTVVTQEGIPGFCLPQLGLVGPELSDQQHNSCDQAFSRATHSSALPTAASHHHLRSFTPAFQMGKLNTTRLTSSPMTVEWQSWDLNSGTLALGT